MSMRTVSWFSIQKQQQTATGYTQVMAGKKKKAKTDTISFIWTDDEVELLLNVTLQYKAKRLQESVDWDSCYTKYADIAEEFREQYPNTEEAKEVGKDFPHIKELATKLIVTTKLKNIRGKFREAIDDGRKSGHGRVVMIFFELCGQIWGGSPATCSIPSGIESSEINMDHVDQTGGESSASVEPPDNGHDADGEGDGSAAGVSSSTVKDRRNLLEVCLWS